MPFTIEKFEIPDLKLIIPKIFEDERGYFLESYKQSDYLKFGIKEDFIQDNFSYSKKNVLRGLHYQASPHTQGKLVHCLHGKVLDVAVDIRHGSASFGKWRSFILSDENHHTLYVPPGFAHGFYTLSESAFVIYKTSCEYAAGHDRGICYDDPTIDIDWQLQDLPIISEKDKRHPRLAKARDIPRLS